MILGRLLENTTINVLKIGIEGTNERHKAIANNIANVDTPKYQRATVEFEEQLKRAINHSGIIGRRTNPAHFIIGGPEEINLVRPRVDIDNITRFRADKNNINIDEEMADLAENTQRNVQFTELLTRRYSSIKQVISEAGKT